MTKVKYKRIKWEEVDDIKKADFKMLFYSYLRLARRMERKVLQMAEAYKDLEKK